MRYVLLHAAGLDDQNAKKLSDASSDARQTVKKVHCSLIDIMNSATSEAVSIDGIGASVGTRVHGEAKKGVF